MWKDVFVQKLARNNFFDEIKKTQWVSYIDLEKHREAEIQSCSSCRIEFHYPKTLNSFENMLEQFKLRSKTAKKS